jgi:hypothetical protein
VNPFRFSPRSRVNYRRARRVAALLMIAANLPCAQLAAAASIQSFGQGSDSDDARFGAEVGAATAWQPSYVPLTGASASFGFNGHATLSCDHIDFKGFLSQFNPGELIHDMKDVVMHGAQAAAFDYLIALAYSTPTVASVLDMMDKRLADRFHAFAQTCSVQQARRIGEEQGAKKMADASDQCFAKQVSGGASPTDAYRTCSIDHAFGALDLPALANTTDFLRRFTNLNVTREVEVLLGMLPDERIQGGMLQMRAPPTSVAAMTDGLRQRARAALDLVEGGADPTHIAACTADDLSGAGGGDPACLPPSAAALVASPAFRGVRLLNAQSRELYKDALSSQIASVAAYSNILELQQQIARLDVKSNSGVDAQEAMTRRQHLLDQSNRLLGQADTQVRIEEGKLRVARTQLLALEHAEDRLESAGQQLAGENRSQSFGVRDFVRLFVDR